MTTEITTAQIKSLRSEAAQAGDRLQVAICEIALGNEPDLDGLQGLGPSGLTVTGERVPVEALTQDQAIEACADVIAEAQAQG